MNTKAIDLSGTRVGKLTVVERLDNGKKYRCKCDCGNETIVWTTNLRRTHTTSCGCVRSENLRSIASTHGESKTRLFRIWCEMKHRCTIKSDTNYIKYGGRGISVCDEWCNDFTTFRDWAMSNGYRDDLTIDRIDGTGNYEPSNCRWATYTEQNINRTFKQRSD